MTVLMAVSSPHHFKMVMVVVRAVVRVANVIFVGMLFDGKNGGVRVVGGVMVVVIVIDKYGGDCGTVGVVVMMVTAVARVAA